jgi:hypothetical protein
MRRFQFDEQHGFVDVDHGASIGEVMASLTPSRQETAP